jgi:hypothetical protein
MTSRVLAPSPLTSLPRWGRGEPNSIRFLEARRLSSLRPAIISSLLNINDRNYESQIPLLICPCDWLASLRLLMSQSFHWVNAGCPAGRHVGRKQRDGSHHHRAEDNRRGAVCRQVLDQTRCEALAKDGDGRSDR